LLYSKSKYFATFKETLLEKPNIAMVIILKYYFYVLYNKFNKFIKKKITYHPDIVTTCEDLTKPLIYLYNEFKNRKDD
jgi:hypothetical protein